MPLVCGSHVAPPSRVRHTPPLDTATTTVRGSRGSTQIEWMAAWSAPPPFHFTRVGWFQSDSTSFHDAPRSSERNRPPGIVPAHSAPGASVAASSAQMFFVAHSRALPHMSLSTKPSGLGGYAGMASSVHVSPASSERCSFTPK